jgi:hypothetical protein
MKSSKPQVGHCGETRRDSAIHASWHLNNRKDPNLCNSLNFFSCFGVLLTVLLLIPRHGRLEKAGKDNGVIAELILYNWPRTLSISAQSVVAVLMLVQVYGAA